MQFVPLKFCLEAIRADLDSKQDLQESNLKSLQIIKRHFGLKSIPDFSTIALVCQIATQDKVMYA